MSRQDIFPHNMSIEQKMYNRMKEKISFHPSFVYVSSCCMLEILLNVYRLNPKYFIVAVYRTNICWIKIFYDNKTDENI